MNEVVLMWHHYPTKSQLPALVKNTPPSLRIQSLTVRIKAHQGMFYTLTLEFLDLNPKIKLSFTIVRPETKEISKLNNSMLRLKKFTIGHEIKVREIEVTLMWQHFVAKSYWSQLENTPLNFIKQSWVYVLFMRFYAL